MFLAISTTFRQSCGMSVPCSESGDRASAVSIQQLRAGTGVDGRTSLAVPASAGTLEVFADELDSMST